MNTCHLIHKSEIDSLLLSLKQRSQKQIYIDAKRELNKNIESYIFVKEFVFLPKNNILLTFQE